MGSSIDELAQKLVSEGVERGQAQADKIVAEAKETAAQLVAEAQSQADEIRKQGRKDAEALEANTKSELKMFAAQALSALKSEVANVVCGRVVNEAVAPVAADKAFMQQFLLKLAEQWGGREDIVISTEDAAALKSYFAAKAKSLLDKGVKIEQVNGQKAAFAITPADGSYRVDFGEEQFEDFFKSFLRPQLIDMLF